MAKKFKPQQLPDDAYLRALEADNDRLRLRVADLEAQVAKLSSTPEFTITTPSAEFGFTPSEAGVFARLVATGFASNEDLLAMAKGKGASAPKMKVIDVYICKIRKKVERFDIVIETLHGRGYRIPAESLQKVAKIQAGTQLAAAG